MTVVDLSLVALRDPVPGPAARLWWNGKESALDDLIERCPQLWIGQAAVDLHDEPHHGGPAGRIFASLFLHGTIPEYGLPLLDHTLHSEIMSAFEPRTDDPPVQVAAMADLRDFLDDHEGWHLVTAEAMR
ncbi:hypothetical protein ACWCW7_07170 [Nocardia tengchongensis]